MFGGGVPPEEVWIDDIDVALLVQQLRDFVDQVLSHDVIVQLLGFTNFEKHRLELFWNTQNESGMN